MRYPSPLIRLVGAFFQHLPGFQRPQHGKRGVYRLYSGLRRRYNRRRARHFLRGKSKKKHINRKNGYKKLLHGVKAILQQKGAFLQPERRELVAGATGTIAVFGVFLYDVAWKKGKIGNNRSSYEKQADRRRLQ